MLKKARLDRVTAETRRIERDVRAWLARRECAAARKRGRNEPPSPP